MKLIEFEQGKDLNAELFTRNEKRISNLTAYFPHLIGNVEGTLHLWNGTTGKHTNDNNFDLMVKIDTEPEYTFHLRLKDFVSSKFDTLEDLKHYLSHEIIKQGTIIKEQK